MLQKITPCLWFSMEAQEAAEFYVGVFSDPDRPFPSEKESAVGTTSKYTKAGYEVHGMEAGTVLTVEFTLDGQKFLALNGGPNFKFNEAVSFVVNCEDQSDVDFFWDKLSVDKPAEQCGWLKDKFGLSWQITPSIMSKFISDPDTSRVDRVMTAMMEMKKLNLATLERAYRGE